MSELRPAHLLLLIMTRHRWLYTLFLMLDANLRAKCKARGLDPFELGPGWSYFVEETGYQAHLKRCGAQKEVRPPPFHVAATV